MKTLLLLLSLISGTLTAQESISIQPGLTHQLKNGEKIYKVHGANHDQIVVSVLNSDNRIDKLMSFAHDGKLIGEHAIPKLFPENLFVSVNSSNAYVLTTILKENHKILVKEKLDKEFKLIDSQHLLKHKIDSDIHAGDFKVEIAADRGGYAVLQESPKDLGGNEELLVHMYDFEFKELWSSTYQTSFKQTNNPTNRIIPGNDGVVHLVKRLRKGSEYHYYVYQFMKDKPAAQHHLDLRGPRITELNMGCDAAGNLLVSGFYTKTTYEESVGYFHRIYGTQGHVKTKIQRDFKPEFMAKFIGKKAFKKDASLAHVEISAIYSAWDHFMIVYENQLMRSVKQKGSDETVRKLTNGPIHIECIDSKGDFVKAIDIKDGQETWNNQAYFASFYTYNLFGGAKDDARLLINSISSNDKANTAVVPFNKTTILNIHGNADHQFSELKLNQLKQDGSMLVSPKLSYCDRGRWYFVLSDLSRSTITPAIGVYE